MKTIKSVLIGALIALLGSSAWAEDWTCPDVIHLSHTDHPLEVVTNDVGAAVKYDDICWDTTGDYRIVDDADVAKVIKYGEYVAVTNVTRDGDAQISFYNEAKTKKYIYNVMAATVEIVKTVMSANNPKNPDPDPTNYSNATIRIVTHILNNPKPKVPNVLFFGTGCGAHGLSDEEVCNALNGMREVANVDWYIFGNWQEGDAKDGLYNSGHIDYQQAEKITTTGVAFDNSKHYSLKVFYEWFHTILTAPATSNAYDYIVIETDGSRLASEYMTNKKENRAGGTTASPYEEEVARLLKPFYDENRVIWIMDNGYDYKNYITRAVSNSCETDPVKLFAYGDDYPGRPYVVNNVTMKNENEKNHYIELLDDNQWRGLLGIYDPTAFLDGYAATNSYLNVKILTGTGTTTDTITTKCARGNPNTIFYTHADTIAETIKGMIKPIPHDIELVDNVITLGEEIPESMTIVGGEDGVHFFELDPSKTNGMSKADFIHFADSNIWIEITSSDQTRLSVNGNTVSGSVFKITQEWWNKIEIDVVTAPDFLKKAQDYQAKHPEWTNLSKNEDGKWTINPNEGDAQITLFRGEGAQRVKCTAHAEATTEYWELPDDTKKLVLESSCVTNVYDGAYHTLTNYLVYEEGDLTKAPIEDAIISNSLDEAEWFLTNAVPDFGFINVTNDAPVYIQAFKAGYDPSEITNATVTILKRKLGGDDPGADRMGVVADDATMTHGKPSTMTNPLTAQGPKGLADGDGLKSVGLICTKGDEELKALDVNRGGGGYDGYISTNLDAKVAIVITNSQNEVVTGNYDIEFFAGKLKVLPESGYFKEFTDKPDDRIYKGGPWTPEVVVTNSAGAKLTADTDYTTNYYANVDATNGAYVVIRFQGNYEGVVTNYFTIHPKAVTIKSGTKTDFTYDGEPHAYTNLETVTGFVLGEGLKETNGWATVTTVAGSPKDNAFTYALKDNTLEGNYTFTVMTGKVGVVAASITPKQPGGTGDNPGEEPAEDPSAAPSIWARNVVKCYDGIGTNVIAKVYNFKGDNNFTYLYSTNESAGFVDWKELQFTNVVAAQKVWYTAKNTEGNDLNVTNFAYVTITQRVVSAANGVIADPTNKVYLADAPDLSYHTWKGPAAGALAEDDYVDSVAFAWTNASVVAGLPVGTYEDIITTNGPNAIVIRNKAGEDVTANYVMGFMPGTLTVTAGGMTIGPGQNGTPVTHPPAGQPPIPPADPNVEASWTNGAKSVVKDYDGKATNIVVRVEAPEGGVVKYSYVQGGPFEDATAFRGYTTVTNLAPVWYEATDPAGNYLPVTNCAFVTINPAKITPKKPEEERNPPPAPTPDNPGDQEPPAADAGPTLWAPDVCKYYDGIATNTKAQVYNVGDYGFKYEYTTNVNHESDLVWSEKLSLIDVLRDDDGKVVSYKVFCRASDAAGNYVGTNYVAYVTILPRSIDDEHGDKIRAVHAKDATMAFGSENAPDAEWDDDIDHGLIEGHYLKVSLFCTNSLTMGLPKTWPVGTYPGAITTNALIAVTNAAGEDVTFNYAIAFSNATLTVEESGARFKADLTWAYCRQTGTFFAKLAVSNANENAGFDYKPNSMRFIFCDRTNENGTVVMALNDGAKHARVTKKATYDGTVYRYVELADPSGGGWTCGAVKTYGASAVNNMALVPADCKNQQTPEMYVYRRVNPTSGTDPLWADLADKGENAFLCWLAWKDTAGGDHFYPVLAGKPDLFAFDKPFDKPVLPTTANTILALGLATPGQGEFGLEIKAFNMSDDMVLIRVETTNGSEFGTPSPTARLIIRGTSDLGTELEDLKEMRSVGDGQYECEVPRDVQFMNVKIVPSEIVR